MFLLPVFPFVTDTQQLIEDSVSKALDVGADFVVFDCMTIKEARKTIS